MKLLKIESSKAYYLDKTGDYKEIDLIGKDDLLYLVNQSLENEEAVLDVFDESKVPNQAHQIIYQNIYNKLSELASQRSAYADRRARQFLTEYERYKNDSAGQDGSTVNQEASVATSSASAKELVTEK